MRVGSISVSLEELSQGSESLVGQGTREGNVVAGGLGDGQTVSNRAGKRSIGQLEYATELAGQSVSCPARARS